VTEVSERDLSDVYHLLGLLEADAAGVVATAATEPQIEALQTLHRELEASAKPGKQDRERFFEINERFHMLLLEIADNRWRNQMVADLRKVMKLNRHNSLLKSGRIDESLNEHRALMAALLARDTALAMQRMQEHFKSGLEAAS
jgi:DNA-binding GntR family transcriptional regulator